MIHTASNRSYSRHIVLQYQHTSTTSPITGSLLHYTSFLVFQPPPIRVNMTDSKAIRWITRTCVCVLLLVVSHGTWIERLDEGMSACSE